MANAASPTKNQLTIAIVVAISATLLFAFGLVKLGKRTKPKTNGQSEQVKTNEPSSPAPVNSEVQTTPSQPATTPSPRRPRPPAQQSEYFDNWRSYVYEQRMPLIPGMPNGAIRRNMKTFLVVKVVPHGRAYCSHLPNDPRIRKVGQDARGTEVFAIRISYRDALLLSSHVENARSRRSGNSLAKRVYLYQDRNDPNWDPNVIWLVAGDVTFR